MKKVILFFTLVFFSSIHVFAQYEPLVVEDAHWSARYYGIGWWAPLDFYMKGDTTVNGMDYKKLYYCQNQAHNQLPNLYALVREDVIGKKVYTILMNNESIIEGSLDLNFTSDFCEVGVEHLFFDYSVEVGDTVSHCWGQVADYFDATITVDSSVCIVDYISDEEFGEFPGIVRKNFSIDCTSWLSYSDGTTGVAYGFTQIVEGLGTHNGPFLPNLDYHTITGGNSEFMKYEIAPDYDCSEADAGIGTGISEIFTANNIKVFPSPAKNILHIETDNYVTKGNYKLSTIAGQVLKVGQFEGHRTEVTVNELPTGIYFIQIFDETQLLAVGKVLVE